MTLKTHATDSSLVRLEATTQAATAVFLQRDNWRNGAWIGHYGSQGYSLFGLASVVDVLPPSVTVTPGGMTRTNPWIAAGVYTDPRYLQIPGQPTKTGSASWSTTGTGNLAVRCNDGLSHSVSMLFLDYDNKGRSVTSAAYDITGTAVLIDAARSVGDYATTAVYMTYNISGPVQFNLACKSGVNDLRLVAWFIDPPRSVGGVTHNTDSLLRATVIRTHNTDSLLRATVIRTHNTDSMLLTTVIRTHNTDSVLLTTVIRTHNTDSMLLTTVIRTHNTDSMLPVPVIKTHNTSATVIARPTGYRGIFAHWLGGAARPLLAVIRSHLTDMRLLRSPIITHKTSTLVSRPVIKSHRTDVGLPPAIVHIQSHHTDAILNPAPVTRIRHHGTDADLYGIAVTRTHTTSVRIVPAHTWTHTTDTLISGSRFRASYTDSLHWGTITLTHKVDARPVYTYTASHKTDTLRMAVPTRTHKTSTLTVVSQQRTHDTDALTVRIPLVTHTTDASPTFLRTCIHSTATAITRTPVGGRWSAPRAGTRTPVETVSKNRQQTGGSQTSALYPIGFLLVSRNRIDPILGAAPAVRLLKPGGGWVNAVGAVREVGNGWYELTGDVADRNVAGEIILMANATGAETAFTKFDIVVPATYDVVTMSQAEHISLADTTLVRAFASAALIPPFCLLQAARSLIEWKAPKAAPLVVKAEDGTTAWQATDTVDPTLKPIRGMDPLGP